MCVIVGIANVSFEWQCHFLLFNNDVWIVIVLLKKEMSMKFNDDFSKKQKFRIGLGFEVRLPQEHNYQGRSAKTQKIQQKFEKDPTIIISGNFTWL